MGDRKDCCTDKDELFMRQALDEANLAAINGEVPIGAICVYDGKIISRAHNARETSQDPTGHAEILAIRSASQARRSWRLSGCTLYVTLEPCLMCSGAIINSRIDRVVFGPYDPKTGALGSLYNVGSDPRLNHEIVIVGGVMEEISSKLLSEFFQGLRTR
ncbi:MAG: tRNA adenosine(34) deaminase TadA [Actinomycetota bacterium]|nr:tRNA adenosine(34) deaminase TadA [Actinomycetota bacterium]